MSENIIKQEQADTPAQRREYVGRLDGEFLVEGVTGRVVVPRESLGAATEQVMRIWAAATTSPLANIIIGAVDSRLRSMIETIWRRYGQQPPNVEYVESAASGTHIPSNKIAVVAISSGFDSTGLALSLLDEGYEVYGLFVDGLNRSAYNFQEAKAVQALCQLLGIKLISRKVVNSMACAHIENPVKNLLVYAMAMAEARRVGASVIGLGTFEDDLIDTTYCPSDAGPIVRKFKRYLDDEFFPHELRMALPEVDTERLLHKHSVTNQVQSCMTVWRNLKQIRRAFAKDFPSISFDTWPTNCFRCYKCCGQALIGMDLGTRRYGTLEVETAFRAHCERVLARHLLKPAAEGIKPDAYGRSVEWAQEIVARGKRK